MLTWVPIGVTIGFAALIVAIMVTINRLVAPRHRSPIKDLPFECGNPPSGSAWGRFSVHFYLVAILFLVFDVEVILLIPWAAEIRRLAGFGLIEALIFIAVLVVGLVYAWQRGALDWD
jgi:NADH-quinone oxidoreductase subunit A